MRTGSGWRKGPPRNGSQNTAGSATTEVVCGPIRNKFWPYSEEVGMVWLWGKLHLRLTSRQGRKERLGYMQGSFGLLVGCAQGSDRSRRRRDTYVIPG